MLRKSTFPESPKVTKLIALGEMSRANETEAFVENKNLLAESEQQTFAHVNAEFVRHFQRRIALSIRRRVLLTRVRFTRRY